VARVESRPNHGSTFFFTLPAEEAALPTAQVHGEFTAP
jgi:signal transduction histidine kinase